MKIQKLQRTSTCPLCQKIVDNFIKVDHIKVVICSSCLTEISNMLNEVDCNKCKYKKGDTHQFECFECSKYYSNMYEGKD